MLKKLMKKEEGFTLAELLIVVAIIAVLVAVSIPIFTAQLEKSRESTDMANLRAAKAAVIAAYLTQEPINGVATVAQWQGSEPISFGYDIQSGTIVAAANASNMKGTTAKTGTYTETNNEYKYVSDGKDYTTEKYSGTIDPATGTITWSFASSSGSTTP